ncbi:MAG: Crp/Fnr family transcriptional regulator [Gammaproteobacteria bacterium]|nr:Crp/Fnr family transcriptional regulator [Gammaproteobacteria bacterium]
MTLPENCHGCPVWKKSLFKDFDPGLLDWLKKRKVWCNFTKKDRLFNQGQVVEGIFCHLSGLAKVVQKDGKAKIRFSRLVLPGDTSGHRSLFIEQKYKGTADAISDNVQACFILKSDILYLLSNNASFAKNLVIKISTELKRSEEQQISVKEKTVRARLAHVIYYLCNEYSDQINEEQFVIRSEITKKDLASLLLVANETVIRLMSEMKTEGLISYQDKKIVINDLDKIKKLSRL